VAYPYPEEASSGQNEHSVLLGVSLYVPGLQLEHSIVPIPFENFPGGQSIQIVLPVVFE